VNDSSKYCEVKILGETELKEEREKLETVLEVLKTADSVSTRSQGTLFMSRRETRQSALRKNWKLSLFEAFFI
jgi:hypothetical protein